MTRDALLERLLELDTNISLAKSASYIPGTHKPLLRSGGTTVVDMIPFREGIDRAQDYATRLSQKLRRPMKRVKNDQKESLFVCLVDQRSSLSFGATRTKREFGIEIAGLLGLAALKQEDLVSICIAGLGVDLQKPSGTGEKSVFLHHVLEVFTAPPEDATIDLAACVETYADILPRHASVFVISDWIFPPDRQHPLRPLCEQNAYVRMRDALEALAIQRDVGLIAVQDIRELELPPGTWRVRSGSAARTTVVSSVSGHMRKQLIAERKKWLDDLEALGIDYCLLETVVNDSHIPELLTFLAVRSTG